MTSNALVPVFTGELAGQPHQLCNARDLHAVLESGQDFSNWIKNRIEQYGFAEGEDFSTNLLKSRGRPRTDYHLTLDMAKELAMVENNERGRAVRRYFIAIEKDHRAKVLHSVPAKDTLSKELRAHVNRTAYQIALKQYDTIHSILTECAADNLACGAKESDCFGYIEAMADTTDGTALVNVRDLKELVWNAEQVINTAAQAIAAIKRVENRSGFQLAMRMKRSAREPLNFHKNDRLVQEVIDRIAGEVE